MNSEKKIEELKKSFLILKEKLIRERSDLFENILKDLGINLTIYSLKDLKGKIIERINDLKQAINNKILYYEIMKECELFETTVTYWG